MRKRRSKSRLRTRSEGALDRQTRPDVDALETTSRMGKRPVRRSATLLSRSAPRRALSDSWAPRNRLPDGSRNRRNTLPTRRKITADARLPTARLFTPERDGLASPKETKLGACAARKETRRSVIIATGYGGRNGVRDYDKRRKC